MDMKWILGGIGLAVGGLIGGPPGAAIGALAGKALGGAVDSDDVGGNGTHSIDTSGGEGVDVSDISSAQDAVDVGSWADIIG